MDGQGKGVLFSLVVIPQFLSLSKGIHCPHLFHLKWLLPYGRDFNTVFREVTFLLTAIIFKVQALSPHCILEFKKIFFFFNIFCKMPAEVAYCLRDRWLVSI